MATPKDDAAKGRSPAILYVAAVVAILSVVVVGVNLFAKGDIEERISALDRADLQKVEQKRRVPTEFTPVTDAAGPWAMEAEVYVPVYSSIYAGSGSLRSNLAATLSIHNTSRSESIIVRAVHYFDTNGKLVDRFVDEPHRLGPMATVDFFIDAADVRGGTGANFVVAWAAGAAVSEPLIEAVMIGSVGTKGISFISRGTRVQTTPATTAPLAD
jgi:hypothetical protein